MEIRVNGDGGKSVRGSKEARLGVGDRGGISFDYWP